MGFFVGICEPAGFLLYLNILRICGKRKWYYSLIPELFFHFAIINSISRYSCRRSCFKTKHFDSKLFQGIRKIISCLQSIWSRIIAYISINTSCFQISSGTENHCFTLINSTGICFHTCNFPLFYQKLCYFTLSNGQIGSFLQSSSHLRTVYLLIRLCSQRVDCRAFGTVKHLGLNKGFINIFAHFTAQGIQFPYQMSFGTSTHIRIAGHQCNTVHTDCEHNRRQTKTRPCQSCFTACVACSHNYNIIFFR